jgi:hypothetical protein
MAAPKIVINIGADTGRLGRDLKKADGIVGKFTSAAGTAMSNLAFAAGTAAIAIGIDGTKAAIEDQKSQALLAKQLKTTTGATENQVAAVEDYIEKLMYASNVTDDELRPSLSTLVRATKDVTTAQKLQALAVDISAGTGKDLQTVSLALAKAYGGQVGALGRLGVPLDENIRKTNDFEGAFKALTDQFGGAAAAGVDTMDGKLKNLNIKFDEAKEGIGEAVLPALEELTDWISSDEGAATIDTLTATFGEAFKSAAESLPAIIDGIKAVGKAAGNMGIDLDTFLDPKFMAAAVAFRVTPGPPQVKAIAAIAAYASVGVNQDQGALTNGIANNNLSGQAANALTPGARAAAGAQINASRQAYITGQYGNYANTPAFSSQYGYQVGGGTTIVINGAQDGAAAARGVRNALNQTNAQGVSNQKGKRTN